LWGYHTSGTVANRACFDRAAPSAGRMRLSFSGHQPSSDCIQI
jgi:hypothetical protein